MVSAAIRFAGQFFFQMPEANNDPTFVPPPFDPGKRLDEILKFTGSDPADYFRFVFKNCSVRTAIDAKGQVLATGAQDPIIGSPVDLTGFMVDVSPSAICAVIHAGQLQIGTLAQGTVRAAVQSDLRLNVRPRGFNDTTAAAHYSTGVRIVATPGRSALLDTLAASADLEIGLQLNRYKKALDDEGNPIPNGLTGDVYGFIRPRAEARAADGLRLYNRRLVAHPNIGADSTIEEVFLTRIGSRPMPAFPPIMDIDGYYDVSAGGDEFWLRPLDFIPFTDFAYTTPTSSGTITEYVFYATTKTGEVEIGRFKGDHDEMLATAGLLPFPNPGRVETTDRLAVDVVTAAGIRRNLMIETEWDIELIGERGITLGSLEARNVAARVTRNNRPASGIAAAVRATHDPRSPTVADIQAVGTGQSDGDGILSFTLKARNLEDLGGIDDPVTGQPIHAAPLDRQYGSKAYIAVPNPLRRSAGAVEQIELCVRVLPKVDVAALPGPISYARDIAPLLGYYIRFFPWIHTRHSGTGYRRFLDLGDKNSVAGHVDEILTRLELPDEDHRRMPRSRDAPIGLKELFRRWRDEGLNP